MDEPAPAYHMAEETGLLTTVEAGTTLLTDEAPQPAKISYPELQRSRTGEKILVNKPVFRLGKERSYVDYFISNNNAISRSHADIITRGSCYFVIDLNSTNGTFINDEPVAVKKETELHDGDTLRLANEDFVFKAEGGSNTRPSGCPKCGKPIRPGMNFCSHCGLAVRR